MKKKAKRLLIFPVALVFLSIFFTAGEALAATYYVSPSGSDSWNGSSSTPFRSIQRAADIVNPGDTVIVKPGAYTGGSSYIFKLSRSGAASQPIVFKSETKWGAVLDGRKSSIQGIDIDAAYVTIDGFDVANTAEEAILIRKSYVKIIRNKVHNTGQSGIYTFDYANNITIDSNIIHTIAPPGPDNHHHGVYVSGSDDVVITNNVFYNHPSGWPIHIYKSGSTAYRTMIVNNTFADANTIRTGHIMLTWSSDCLIQNNIFYKAGTGGIRISSSYADTVSNLKTYNNLSTNAIFSELTEGAVSGNISNTDPRFVNASGRDYHLQSASPAINAGTYSGRTYDADGNAISGAPDMGAYEYVGTAGIPAPEPTPEPTPDPTPVPVPEPISEPEPDPVVSDPAPPTAPELVSPGNGETVSTDVVFKWKKSYDANGHRIKYILKVCKDSGLTDCSISIVASGEPLYYAGIGGSASGLLLLGLFLAGGIRRRKKMLLLALSILVLSALLISCGGGGGGTGSAPSGSDEISYPVSGLSTNTAYFWQVTADDETDGTTGSEVRNFVTQ